MKNIINLLFYRNIKKSKEEKFRNLLILAKSKVEITELKHRDHTEAVKFLDNYDEMFEIFPFEKSIYLYWFFRDILPNYNMDICIKYLIMWRIIGNEYLKD